MQRQLAAAPGLIGYSRLGRPWQRQFWVLSVWEQEQAVTTFIHSEAHRAVMRALQPDTGPIRVVRWCLTADGYPPAWEAALAKAAAPDQNPSAA